jgi:hypothetical protein
VEGRIVRESAEEQKQIEERKMKEGGTKVEGMREII